MVAIPTITKKGKLLITYLVIILCGVMFYSHKFVAPHSKEYKTAQKNHINSKKKRTKALNLVKEYSKGSSEYNNYLLAKIETDKAWEKLKNIKKSEKVFGFRSLHDFLERFGLACFIFIYGMFNLIRSFYYDQKNFSSKLFHVFVISVGFFYFFWVFNKFQDFSKFTYFLVTIFSASFLALGVYLFTKYKQSYINSLKGDIREISRFTVLNTKPGKQKEMFSMFDKLLKSKL